MAAQLILTIMLDGLMALLLIITTVYCWRLNKRIRVLQDSKSELAQIIRQFDESTQRATESIAEIHGATSRIAENIQHKIDKANYLADDLQFMIEKGSKLADKMEGNITPARAARQAPAREQAARNQAPETQAESPMPRQQEAKKTPRSEASSKSRRAAASGAEKSRASGLDGVLRKVSGRTEKPAEEAAAAETPRRRAPTARLRSRAEQELFDALKAGGNKA